MGSQGYFITGTDTEIGKTYCSVSLIKHLCSMDLNVAGLKPVASGCEQSPNGLRNADALKLLEASNVRLAYEQVNRYAFEPAIAPHLAAAMSGTNINLNEIQTDLAYAKSSADKVVVEAAGGWLVPLNDQNLVADLALALKLPVIVVVGIKLGCINHALLTFNHIQQSGVEIAGWVANHIDGQAVHADEQVNSIKSRTSIPCIAELPYEGANERPDKKTIHQWHLKH